MIPYARYAPNRSSTHETTRLGQGLGLGTGGQGLVPGQGPVPGQGLGLAPGLVPGQGLGQGVGLRESGEVLERGGRGGWTGATTPAYGMRGSFSGGGSGGYGSGGGAVVVGGEMGVVDVAAIERAQRARDRLPRLLPSHELSEQMR